MAAKGFKGFLSKLDPTTMVLGGLNAILGGDDPFQKRLSYTGKTTNPEATLSTVLAAIKNMSGQLASQSGRSVAPPVPGPVSIPGVPFQIGGGLGADPSQFGAMKLTNPFDLLGPDGKPPAQASGPKPTQRRRPA